MLTAIFIARFLVFCPAFLQDHFFPLVHWEARWRGGILYPILEHWTLGKHGSWENICVLLVGKNLKTSLCWKYLLSIFFGFVHRSAFRIFSFFFATLNHIFRVADTLWPIFVPLRTNKNLLMPIKCWYLTKFVFYLLIASTIQNM